MDPQAERDIFLRVVLNALKHLKRNGSSLYADIDGDGGYGMGLSANKLSSQAESIYRHIEEQQRKKETYMNGEWVKDCRHICTGYIDIAATFKMDVVGPIVDLAAGDAKRNSNSGLRRFMAWFIPKQAETSEFSESYWRKGKLKDEIPDCIKSLETVLAKTDELIAEVERRIKDAE